MLGFRGGLPAPERRVLITRANALFDHGPDEVARLRAMRDAGLTVEVIAEVERTSPRTIYRRLAEASDASAATRTDVA